MFAVPSRLVPVALRLQKRNSNYLTRELAEKHLAELKNNPRQIAPPRRIPHDVTITQEHSHGWPLFRMTPTTQESHGTVLYFHGGAYVHGIHDAHWKFLGHIVKHANVEALVPMYPLVPEGGTAQAVAETAIRIAQDAGEDTILMGDSAGAQIAYSAAVDLRDRGTIAPLTVLISPPIDLELLNPHLPERAPLDPWLCRDGMIVFTEYWLADHGFTHRLNPINDDPTGLGPMLIFSGTLDVLNLDADDWVRTLRAAGVHVEFHEVRGQVHVYPLLPTRAGARARRRIVQALTDTLSSSR